MISYYMTNKGKSYICHVCGSSSWSTIVLKIDGREVQFCDECWKPEYVTLASGKEKVNENVDLSG